MPTVGSAPIFNGTVILVDYHASIRNARVIHAAVYGTVRRWETKHIKLDELLDRVVEVVAEYGCLARIAGRSDGVVELAVTKS